MVYRVAYNRFLGFVNGLGRVRVQRCALWRLMYRAMFSGDNDFLGRKAAVMYTECKLTFYGIIYSCFGCR